MEDFNQNNELFSLVLTVEDVRSRLIDIARNDERLADHYRSLPAEDIRRVFLANFNDRSVVYAFQDAINETVDEIADTLAF